MMKPIEDKKIIKELEKTSVPIINILSPGKKRERQKRFDAYMAVISWYHVRDDIDANSSIYKKWKKVTEQLGFKPISHPVYMCKNGLWAFKWKEDDVLLYYDKRGMKIQVNKEFSKNEIIPMLEELRLKLIKTLKL